jgi:hypothetical protein
VFWAWVIGIVTMPYQWCVMFRDWLRRRKGGSEERKRPHP